MTSLPRWTILLIAVAWLATLAHTQDNPGADAFQAQKALEVGEFYFKKGDVDAAIDRFLEAIRLKSNFARPRLLLGKAYEKKDEKAEAVKYYKEYLELLPKADDAAKVHKRIEKLTKELEKENVGKPRRSSELLQKSLRPRELREAPLLTAKLD